MRNIKVYLFVFLMVILESVSQKEQCDAESQVKMSILSGLRHNFTTGNSVMMKLQASIDIKEAEVAKLNTYLEFVSAVHNKTAADIQELERACEDTVAMDCCQVKTVLPSVKTDIYAIRDPCASNSNFNYGKIHVPCDMETDGGGWIVIQRRNASLGTVNFTRNWEDYENGFGDLDGEFWIGLRNIHELTNQHDVDLQISVWNDTETSITWNYPTFRVAGPENNYYLTVSGGTGDGDRDPIAYHNGNYFSTYDHDHDNSEGNCAYEFQGGWWYNRCVSANLNGRRKISGLPRTHPTIQLVFWYSGSAHEVYTNSEMKIRSKTCSLSC